MSIDFPALLETEFNIAAVTVTGKEFRSICQGWVERFCPNVKRCTGGWVHKGYWWHAYSFNYEKAVTGHAAFEKYQSMPVEPFFIFHQTDDKLYECSAKSWPDLRVIEDDIYVFPRTMAWTFLTTHEMSIGLGPYFSFPPT